MSTNLLREILTMQVLERKHGQQTGDFLLDRFDSMRAEKDNPDVVNVCAKITRELFDEFSTTCAFLSISKRRFIEAAIIQGLKDARDIESSYELFEHNKAQNDAFKRASSDCCSEASQS